MGTLDWIVLGVFFLGLVGIIIYVLRQKEDTTEDYFLAGKKAGWLSIGSSIFASNIGSEHLVGLAGAGFISGMAMAHWEMHAWLILILGWVFVPFYDRIKIFTMPELLERRFSSGSRTVLSIISLVSYVLTKVAVTVYAGGVVFKTIFAVDYVTIFGSQVDFFWVSAIGLVVITGLYTIFGGMKAVMYTSVLQTPVLLIGSIVIVVVGLIHAGGWSEVKGFIGPNMRLIRSASDPEFPWTGVLMGSAIIGFWYWCTDQFIVQRVLSGRNRAIARKGAIFAGYLKVLPVFIFLVPGMIAFALNQQGKLEVASSDSAFAALVAEFLPNGLVGVVAAGLLAALMSSLASLFNSSAMLFVEDFYKKYKKDKEEKHYVVVGRIATAAIVVLGVAWIPVMMGLGKVLYEYLQAVQGLLAPAIASVFLMGVFWKRATAKGALWGMIVGFGIGMFRLILNILYGAKASLISSIEKFKQQIANLPDIKAELMSQVASKTITPEKADLYFKARQSQLVDGLTGILDKEGLGKIGGDQIVQPIVEKVGSVIDVISTSTGSEAIEQSTSILSGLKGQFETMFINDYGILYKIAAINWLHFCIILFCLSIATIVGVSLITTKPTEEQLKYTIGAASKEDKEYTRKGIDKWDIINSIIIGAIVIGFYLLFW